MMTLIVESRSVVIKAVWPRREADKRKFWALDKRLTVSFEPHTRIALKVLADRLERSEGWVVRQAVKRLLNEAGKDQVQLEFDLQREKQLE